MCCALHPSGSRLDCVAQLSTSRPPPGPERGCPHPGPAGGVRLFKWLLRRKLDYEIRLDVRILEGLADKSPSLEGMKLSRFDKVLGQALTPTSKRGLSRRLRRATPAAPAAQAVDDDAVLSVRDLRV